MKRGLLFLLPALAAGCGGSGPATQPRLTVRFTWPNQGARVIPTATQSIVVKVIQGGTTVAQTVLVKPATAATFAELPVGAVTVTASAQPNTDGSGTAMATATVGATIADGSNTNVDMTMASTIDHLTISPNPVNLALLAILTRQIVVTAYDQSNAVVLMSPSDIAYSTTNSLLFNVDSTGLATGLAVGTATVTATERTTGKSATASVVVTLY